MSHFYPMFFGFKWIRRPPWAFLLILSHSHALFNLFWKLEFRRNSNCLERLDFFITLLWPFICSWTHFHFVCLSHSCILVNIWCLLFTFLCSLVRLGNIGKQYWVSLNLAKPLPLRVNNIPYFQALIFCKKSFRLCKPLVIFINFFNAQNRFLTYYSFC